MAWTNYTAPTADIPLGGGQTGSVRGLNIEDLGVVLTNHLDAVMKAVELYTASRQDVYSTDNLYRFVITLATEFPTLVTEVISLAADEPSLKGRKIALGVQISALNEIVRLTLEEIGGLGNLLLVLGNLAKGALSEYQPIREPATVQSEQSSLSSTGASAKT